MSNQAERVKMARDLRAMIEGQFDHSYICGGKPFRLMNQAGAKQEIPGQRVALAKFNVGLDNPRLLAALEKPGVLPVLIPWDTPIPPNVYIDRKWVVIEAAYEYDYQETDIPLKSVTSTQPTGGIVLGPNMHGSLITLYLQDMVHLLIGGETGSGKTFAVRSITSQVADGKNQLVLVDGKFGEGLGILNGLPGQIGPLAMADNDVINALGWVWSQMTKRYDMILANGGIKPANAWDNLIVIIDEFQTYTEDNRLPIVTKQLRELSRQGRAVDIKVFVDTQKPTVNAWGDSATRDQYTTRLGLATQSFAASDAVMSGNMPRLDHLVGKGDSYIKAKVKDGEIIERIQMAYIPEVDLKKKSGGATLLHEWPEFDTSRLGEDGNDGRGRPQLEFDTDHQACAVRAAQLGYGRTNLQRLLDRADCPINGTSRVNRLMEWGREINAKIEQIEAIE